MVCEISLCRVLGKSFSDYGKSKHHPYLISAIQTHKGVLFLMQFHHLMSPALCFLWLLHIYSTSLSLSVLVTIVCGVKTTNIIKVIGVRDTNNSITIPCNYRLHTSRVLCCRPFPGASRDTKTYYQSNFPLSPRAKQSVWEVHALFILAEIEQGENISDWAPSERELP